ncbi:MAG: SMP-30/gluconolactonase/LRE family protein [Rhodospirillales bacterium]
MIVAPIRLDAEIWSLLPDDLHWSGPMNSWVNAARPGQTLHSFLEGPCFTADGRLWLTDVPFGRLFSISPDGVWRLEARTAGQPHAVKLMADGRLAMVDYLLGLLTFTPETGASETLCASTNTESFRGLSDLAIAPNGDIWFTDSGRTSLTDPTGRLFVLRTDRRLQQPLSNVPYPNGVALSPDGKLVYVAATRANAVWRLNADWTDPVRPMAGLWVQLAGGLGPDGLAVDRRGRVAIAHAQAGRVWLLTAMGDPVAEIRTPGGLWVTSVTFGGPDDSYLYIVEARQGAVYRIRVGHLDET